MHSTYSYLCTAMIDEKSRTTAKAALTEYLRIKKLRKTPERYAILDKVCEMNRHFDIDMLYDIIEEDGFHVSRATLYNTMELFTDCKIKEAKDPELVKFMNSRKYSAFHNAWFCLYVYGTCAACARRNKRLCKNKNYIILEMKVDVLLGLQWGDEGKGKVVDVLTPRYDVVARFQGGPNAGHTLEFEGKKYVLRSIPSGIFQHGQTNIIGNGVVLDPVLFREEAEALEKSGIKLKEVLKLSKKAHLIMPTHRLLDAANEKAKGGAKIGTTGKGIGPTYTDKVSRNGLRLGDVCHNFDQKYNSARNRHVAMLNSMGENPDFSELEAKWLDAVEYLKSYDIIDSEHFINKALKDGKSVLCEGAQGTLLDVDFGSYPFVTSSNTVCAGACTGLGVAPNRIGEVFGIFKAYCTRVGSGPFPTELFDETGKRIRDLGHEYGAVTGRERRCGWIDLVALKYAIMINGVTQLIMMKSDVLDDFDEIKACVAYEINGNRVDDFPFSIEDDTITPVYVTMPGWKTDMTAFKSEDDFPRQFKDYIEFLEKELETPITIVSIGPDREQTIIRKR